MDLKTKKENVKPPQNRKKHQVKKNYNVTHRNIDGKKIVNYYAKLEQAREAGIILYRLNRFISLKNKKGVVLPL